MPATLPLPSALVEPAAYARRAARAIDLDPRRAFIDPRVHVVDALLRSLAGQVLPPIHRLDAREVPHHLHGLAWHRHGLAQHARGLGNARQHVAPPPTVHERGPTY